MQAVRLFGEERYLSLSLWTTVLWVFGFLLNLVLVFVLFYKRRGRAVPWFTVWIVVDAIDTIALFLVYRFGSRHSYAVLYWTADFLDVLLQIAVVLEIARYVLKRSGRWVEGSRLRLVLMGTSAPLVALAMAWLMKPAAETRLDAFAARSSLFTTILVCLLFTAVLLVSQQLGLGLRSHVMRESYGFIVWTLVAFVTDTLHAYWATMGHFTLLEDVRIVVFQGTLLYWAVAFWLPEPAVEKLPIPAKLRLDELASRLDYAQSRRASRTGAVPK